MISTTQPAIHTAVALESNFWARARHRMSTFLSTRLNSDHDDLHSQFGHHAVGSHAERLAKRVTEMAKDFYRAHVDSKTDGNGIHGGYMIKRRTRDPKDDKIGLAALFGPFGGGLWNAMTPPQIQTQSLFTIPEETRADIKAAWNRLYEGPVKGFVRELLQQPNPERAPAPL